MPLTRCRECEGQVSTQAEACPHCGAPLKPKRRGCLYWVGIAVAAALIVVLLIFVVLPMAGVVLSGEIGSYKETMDAKRRSSEASSANEERTVRLNPGPLSEGETERVRRALRAGEVFSDFDARTDSSGRLIVILKLEAPPMDGRALGEKALLAVLDKLYDAGRYDSFRVSLHGPPPAPGIVKSYGVARFSDERGMTWAYR